MSCLFRKIHDEKVRIVNDCTWQEKKKKKTPSPENLSKAVKNLNLKYEHGGKKKTTKNKADKLNYVRIPQNQHSKLI